MRRIKIATPISHLFGDERLRKLIQDLSDCLECRDKSVSSTYEGQEVFHCELQPIHCLRPRDWEYLQEIKEGKASLRLLTFHIACCYDQPTVSHRMFEPGGTLYTKDEMALNARLNIERIRQIFGSHVQIAVENNNYYPGEAYMHVTDPDFISEVVYTNNIRFLFDIAHARITCHNQGICYEDYKQRLPFDKVIQLHISTYAIDDQNMAYDAHNVPSEEDVAEVRDLTESHDVEYLTLEYYRDAESLLASLEVVKGIRDAIAG